MAKSSCENCGKPKALSAKESSDTAFEVCSCSNENEKQSLAQTLTYRLCTICQKRIGAEGDSETDKIFSENFCKCQKPEPFNFEAVSDEIGSDFEDELELDPDRFPKDRYKPIEKLGSGAGGEVYLAKDRILEKYVAVKILNVLNMSQLVAFQKEAWATSKLRHPNIIEILDFGATGSGTPYMVLEYFNGTTLASLIKEKGHLEWHYLEPVTIQIGEALAYSHKQKIFHRDLKPSNILIKEEAGKDLEAKLIDFGIAKVSEITGSTAEVQGKTLAGTPNYMSPDVFIGLPFTSSSEVYSMGCVLYEALTGHVPFQGETPFELLNKHAYDDPPAMEEMIDDEIATVAKEVVYKCLKKDQDNRFNNMDELVQAVRTTPASIDPPSSAEPTFRKFEKVVFLIAFLLATMAAIMSYQSFSIKLLKNEKKSIAIKIPDEKIQYPEEEMWYESHLFKCVLPRKKRSTINDTDLKQIAEDLENRSPLFLNLCDSKLNGSGLKYLNRLPIKFLCLENVHFDEQYMKELNIPTLQLLSLKNTNISNNGLLALLKMKNLKSLDLMDCSKLTDEAICELIENSEITSLNLSGTSITDQALGCISKSNLVRVGLDRTNISDSGLIKLAQMKYLRQLAVTQCNNVTMKSIKTICENNSNMEVLDIPDLSIEGISLSFLSNCKNLKTLNLSGVPVTDSDMKMIGAMKDLSVLYLAKTQISDSALKEIYHLKLHHLTVLQCPNVTREGVKKMKAHLPDSCTFITSYGADPGVTTNMDMIETLFAPRENN